jgi:hypothetical protein
LTHGGRSQEIETTETPEAGGGDVFVDTSIVIALTVHSPELKALIRRRLGEFARVVTGSIVKQEYKRRLLREAEYLLRTLEKLGSYEKLRRHVSEVLPPQQQRKRNICEQMLNTFFEEAGDGELTERLQRYLRMMLVSGHAYLEGLVDEIRAGAGCGWSRAPLREIRPYKRYDLGGNKCSDARIDCGICEFVGAHRAELELLREYLRDVGDESVRVWLLAIETMLGRPEECRGLESCLKLGDLLIALESGDVGVFYTMNGRDSRHLARPLGQTLVVRPRNPERDDIICKQGDEVWRVE